MITEDNVMSLIISRVTEFKDTWEAHLLWWQDQDRGLCNDMGALTKYVKGLILAKDLEALPNVFTLVEELMVDGTDKVKEAAATCFLENLLNLCPKVISADSFVNLLGSNSKAYCQAWDKFTGVQTPGL